MKVALLALLFLIMLVFPIMAKDASIVVQTSQTDYSDGYPEYSDDYSGYSDRYPEYSDGYSGSMQTGSSVSYPPTGSEGQYSDSLAMYQEFYDMGQGTQSMTAPAQFQIYGSEPSYLIINGQSKPYDPYYVPTNSFWIQGKTSWTQYMKCPLNARFRMLAYSQGGPTTVVEDYPNGYQMVNQYNFYRGYTQLIFWADMEGRHTLKFYNNGQPSNPVIVDVLPYAGSGYPGYSGYPGHNVPYGGQTSSVIKTTITYTGQTTGQPKGKSKGTPQSGPASQEGSRCQCSDGRNGFMQCYYYGDPGNCRCNCSSDWGGETGYNPGAESEDYSDPLGLGKILIDSAEDGFGEGF